MGGSHASFSFVVVGGCHGLPVSPGLRSFLMVERNYFITNRRCADCRQKLLWTSSVCLLGRNPGNQ
jgi:hypothetical protein